MVKEDDLLEKEDDLRVKGHDVVDQRIPRRDFDTDTSFEAGETGLRETILGQDGGVATGFVLTNLSAPTDDPAGAAPITGTTTIHTVWGPI